MRLPAILLISATLLAGQSQTLRVDVQLSEIVVTVTDSRGRHVTNLSPEDFIVEVDGRQERVAHLSQDSNTPVAIGLAIDMSGSMRPRLKAAKTAGRTFINNLAPADEFLLTTFSDSLRVQQPLTRDRQKISAAFESLGPGEMRSTNLLTSVLKAEELLRKSSNKKRALVLITDGLDSECAMSDVEFSRRLLNAGVMVYGIRMPLSVLGVSSISPILLNPSRKCLTTPRTTEFFKILESATGGRSFETKPDSTAFDDELNTIFAQISADLRGQYTLGFYPEKRGDVAIRVRTTHPEYQVRTQQRSLIK